MIQEIDLLNQIHQNADMAQDSIRHIIDLSDDTEFLKALGKQMEDYQNTCCLTEKILSNYSQPPADAKPVAKFMSHISTNLKTITDCSTSKLAEMMVKGSTMGVTNLTRQINAYEGTNQEILSLAKSQLKTEEKNLEEMKKFL